MMDAKTEKKLRSKVIEMCEGASESSSFKFMNDDEYVGYQTAMVMSNSLNLDASMEEKFNMVKALFKEGLL